jgi:2-polyprenyl-6-methoxyphenol hydroxylase-like FAD-dependent oxidoreductase
MVLIEAFAPDSAAQPSFDERTTALGNASRRVFEALGLWPRLAAEAAPITAIHVSDAGRYGFARLDARSMDQDALGYVVPNRVLGRELWQVLSSASRVTSCMPARLTGLEVCDSLARLVVEQQGAMRQLQARLVVAADGAQSMVRGVAGLGAGIAFGLITRSRYNECEGNVRMCSTDDRDSIRTFGILADASFVLAIGGAIATTVFYMGSAEEPRVIVSPTTDGATVSAFGRF